MTPRNTKRQRLEAAGYRCLKDVWVPEAEAARVEQIAAEHAADVARIAETRKPSGRPKKDAPA